MDIEHISVSRMKCFEQCAQMYKFRYHLKVPRPGEEPFYFVYGKIVHKIAELFVECNGERSLGDIKTDVLRGKIEIEEGKIAPALPTEYKNKLGVHLRAIQSLNDKIGSQGIVEHKFKYDLDPPHGRHVTGFIDRLIIKNDKAWIIDYKTTKKGKWRETKESIKRDPQLSIYARVVQKDFGIDPKNISTALYYVDGGDLIAASFSQESLNNVEKKMLEAYKSIEEANPDKVWGNVGEHCGRCDYCTICPFYKPRGKVEKTWDGDFNSLKF